MDLLYKHERYEQVLHILDMFTEKQLDLVAEKYPYSCSILAVAACHKLVSLSDELMEVF